MIHKKLIFGLTSLVCLRCITLIPTYSFTSYRNITFDLRLSDSHLFDLRQVFHEHNKGGKEKLGVILISYAIRRHSAVFIVVHLDIVAVLHSSLRKRTVGWLLLALLNIRLPYCEKCCIAIFLMALKDNTVWNRPDFDCLDSRRDLEGSVERKCKDWRHKWIGRWKLRVFRPSQRLC